MVLWYAPDMSNTPALLMRQCTGSPRALSACANARTESSESRSRCITSQFSGDDAEDAEEEEEEEEEEGVAPSAIASAFHVSTSG